MLRGIMPVLVTPMHKDGSPDLDGHVKLLEHVMKKPIVGLWILGSASEDFMLDHDHRVEITKTVAETVGDRTHVIAGLSDPVHGRMLRFFDETADMKLSGYHWLPNERRMSSATFLRQATELAERAPKPLWLYNNPMRGVPLSTDAIREVSEHPNVAGIKAAGFNLMEILPLTTMNRDDFQVIGSGGGHLLLFLVQGCTCHTVSQASLWPGTYIRIFDLFFEGKIDEARRIAFAVGGVLKALPHPDNSELSAEEKAVLEVMGICERWVAPPFRPCTDEEMDQARKVLAASPVELG